jgi:hypothetical protein
MNTKLPLDILYHIFKLIHVNNRAGLRLVCSYWKSILDNKSIWDDLLYVSDAKLSRLSSESLQWLMDNTYILGLPSVINMLINKPCSYKFREWFVLHSKYSEYLLSDIMYIVELLKIMIRYNVTESKRIYYIIASRFPRHIKMLQKSVIECVEHMKPIFILDVMREYEIEIDERHLFDAIISYCDLFEQGLITIEEIRRLTDNYIPSERYVATIKKLILIKYRRGKFQSLRLYADIFNIGSLENDKVITYILTSDKNTNKKFMKIFYLLPTKHNKHLWNDKIYQIRSANFIYKSLLLTLVTEEVWGELFEWSMELFPSYMKLAEKNAICKRYGNIPCLITIAMTRSDHKYIEKLMKVMELSKKTIAKHSICRINNAKCVLKGDKDLSVLINNVLSNAEKLNIDINDKLTTLF